MNQNRESEEYNDEQNEEEIQSDAPELSAVGEEDIEDEATAGHSLELDEIQQIKLELDEYKNLYLRKAAEFENFKRRKQQEFQALIQSAEETLIGNLLPVLDDFDRLQNSENADSSALLDGFSLIRDKFWDVLASRGLQPIEAVGKPFDPQVHEAIMQQAEEGTDPDIVLQEHERGYRLRDKVIRHAKVIVST